MHHSAQSGFIASFDVPRSQLILVIDPGIVNRLSPRLTMIQGTVPVVTVPAKLFFFVCRIYIKDQDINSFEI